MSDLALDRTFTTDPRRLLRAFTDEVERDAWAGPLGDAVFVAGERIDGTRTADDAIAQSAITVGPAAAGAQLSLTEGPYDSGEAVDRARTAWAGALDALDALVSPEPR